MIDADESKTLLAEALGLGSGDCPFPWQIRLLGLFRDGEIPRALDIPTGLGKTATIAIWLLARAHGAYVPRRLVYVVDRRAVVDQATEVASRLRQWVAQTPRVRDGLGLESRLLPISTLRGQFVDNREWLEDPAGPAIVVGTVDMVGSRLLFEGYGASRKMRPYYAGLLGNDSLIVLDEAHLTPPFERLLERIALDGKDLHSGSDAMLGNPPAIRLLSLSATGRSLGGEPFELAKQDLGNKGVCTRLSATKRLTIEGLPATADLATLVAERAWALSDEGARPIRCIVFTTSRKHAETALYVLSTLAGLTRRMKGEEAAADVELLVGGRRVYERLAAADTLRDLGFLAGSDRPNRRPAFLFATSAGEVGVDLDADHMVSDLVAWERMVQRLGRVNRRGKGDAHVHVLAEPLPDKATADQVARRDAVRALVQRLPLLSDGSRDASPGALRDLQRAARRDEGLGTLVAQACTPPPLYPALERPTLDAWSMTSLRHNPARPVVAPWLRGWTEDQPQTTVLWRTYLPIPISRAPRVSDIVRFFEAAPPHTSEKLDTESSRVAEWLRKRVRQVLVCADKAAPGNEVDPDILRRETTVAILLSSVGDGDTHNWTLEELSKLDKKELDRELEGATLVLDARLGGLSDGGLLDSASDSLPTTGDGGEWLGGSDDDEAPTVRFRVRETLDTAAIEDVGWRERARWPRRWEADEVTHWLVVEKWRHDAATEDDRSAGCPQLLDEHQTWTEERARRLSGRLGLPADATEILAIAARLHDEGKRAARWQAAFSAPTDGVYAKTLGPLDVHRLDGYRHEFGSLPFAERAPALAVLPDDQRDLVLHLIASHHGFARPVISINGCPEPPSAVEKRARDVALRFARLQRSWGPWGLAWWEALLRSADQQASRDNDARTRDAVTRHTEDR